MDSREYTGWMVFEATTGPLGPERTDFMLAQLCAVLANVNRGKKEKAREPADFAPPWADRQVWPWKSGTARARGEQVDPEEMLRTIRGIHRQMGGG